MAESETRPVLDDEFYEDGASPSKKVWPWLVGGAVLLGGAYFGAGVVLADQVPTNTYVSGVDIGGLSEDAAIAKVQSEVGDIVTDPVPLTIEGTDVSAELNPSDVGVAIDAKETVAGLTGLSFNPAHLWRHVSGTTYVEPVVTFDQDKLATTITNLNSEISSKPVDATISFAGSTIQVTKAQPGIGLDVEPAIKILEEGWLSASRPISLPSTEIEPQITDAQIESVRSQYAEPLVSGPMTIEVGDKTAKLSQADLAAAASFTASEGKVSFDLDTTKLVDEVLKQTSDALQPAKNAQIVMDGHTAPKIIPSQDGVAVDKEATAQLISDTALATERDVKAVVDVAKPDLTTEDAEKLGVKEVVAAIETPLTNDAIRTQNLIVGTQKTNNSLVLPGEEFSLLSKLGEITEANGYVSSGVVMNGFNSTALGGGLSQLSTNTFNLGYRGGMEDIQHQPHSKYFDRYPMGVESTLWVPTLDMKWKNNSPYAVLVETWVEGGMVKSRLWSTKYYDVDITVSQPYNYVEAKTKDNPNSDCEPSPPGGSGFTVDVRRIVKAEGQTVYDNSYSWTYQPVHGSKCV